MKGQFFIIASVIMISATMVLIQYLFDYGKIDLTKIEERGPQNYIQSIKDTLAKTAQDSDCSILDKKLRDTEAFIKTQMIKKGIVFTVSHQINCPSVNFDFSLQTTDTLTNTQFTYP